MTDEIMVSINVITYNHEKYVRKCLESLVNQKTNFKFEIIIHDDASPDNTQAIIREFEEKYPDIIRPIYQTENQHSKNFPFVTALMMPMVRGKYVSFCEGDDYWTDENKLQKQFDFLESHPETVAVSHKYEIINENDEHLEYSHEGESLDRFFTNEDVLRLKAAAFHPNTMMYRADARTQHYYDGRRKCCNLGGHVYNNFYFQSLSPVYVMNDCMSIWRKEIKKGGTSFASRQASHPISYGNMVLKNYVDYREFFGASFNFDKEIRKMLAIQLKVDLKNKEDGINKGKAILDTLKCVNVKDIFALPYYMFK